MFKAGDVVEITDESDATGMLDFVKGKGYTVELYAGGMVNVVNESGKLGWYSKHHFKLKEKEEKKVETLFKAGQVVWDVVYGKGVVTEIVEYSIYPVVVQFSDETMAYSVDGKTYETHGRTLFFSEPKIEAATEPVFEPVLKKGDVVIISGFKDRTTIEAFKIGVVEEETEEFVYTIGNASWDKYARDFYRLGEKIVFN